MCMRVCVYENLLMRLHFPGSSSLCVCVRRACVGVLVLKIVCDVIVFIIFFIIFCFYFSFSYFHFIFLIYFFPFLFIEFLVLWQFASHACVVFVCIKLFFFFKKSVFKIEVFFGSKSKNSILWRMNKRSF